MIAEVSPLVSQDLADAVALDLQIFGGWWSLQGYQRELQRFSSALFGLRLQSERSSTDPQNLSVSASPSLIGIGCLWRVLDEAHITMLGIHPQYQGKGARANPALISAESCPATSISEGNPRSE